MGIPLIVLAFGSIFWGYLTKDLIIGLGTDFWQSAIFVLPKNNLFIESEFIPSYVKLVPTILSFSGAILAIVLNHYYADFMYNSSLTPIGLRMYAFLNKKWYFDKFYNECINKPLVSFGYFVSFRTMDKGIVEMLGPYGAVNTFSNLMKTASKLQTGYIYHYAFIMLVGLVLFLATTSLWFTMQSYLFVDNRLLFIYVAILLFYTTSSVSKA
jgi:NADH-ubiquinone oxidoreductase chain 5